MQQNPNYLFALDIGTRSVIGVILEKKEKEYIVIDVLMKEHEERSMLDGQIHDTLLVSEVISDIKNELEKKYGPLRKVYVAAAGRALKTKRGQAMKDISTSPFTTKEEIVHLELSAVQNALYNLVEHEKEENNHFYCVGYSVVHYELDSQIIGNLIDQRGTSAKAEVIATFLPRIVVESLLAALTRSKLEMAALTLEPIAAMFALVPPSMRRLNIALVDIGAGTSDIAITKDETIVAYGMVPTAGDEITEAICDACLLDYDEGEKIKRKLNDDSTITYTDVLGFEQKIESNKLLETIEPSCDQLAEQISETILSLNHTSPQAVMLIGGGSLTPNITYQIAKHLKLPKNRVAIRGSEAIKTIKQTENTPKGPLYITPIGIGISAFEHPITYLTVTINQRKIRLFNFNQLTVGDALVASGIDIQKLYGKPGMGITYECGDKIQSIPGTLGHAPKIIKNEQPASLLDSIHPNDTMIVSKGENGQDAKLTVSQLEEMLEIKKIKLNGKAYTFKPTIFINNKKADKEDILSTTDSISIQYPTTLKEVLEVTNTKPFTNVFYLFINGEKTVLKPPSFREIMIHNGKPSTKEVNIHTNDFIEWKLHGYMTVKELKNWLKSNHRHQSLISITFNNQSLILEKDAIQIQREGSILNEQSILEHGDKISTSTTIGQPFIFQDIFRFVDIELPTQTSKNFEIFINEQPAQFNSIIQHGDQLSLKWK